MKNNSRFAIRLIASIGLFTLVSQWVMAQENNEHDHPHDEDKKANLAFQCAVCSNHLGFVEPNTEIKGGFALSAHKHSLVEVEGLYQCSACQTPIFKSKNKLDLPDQEGLLYFSRPINDGSITILPYDVGNLGELRDHCPVCANKFANSATEVVSGNFGSRISFKDLRGIFRKQ